VKFRDHLKEQLKDPEFRGEYESFEPEYEIIRQIIIARKELNITQKELAERTGIKQGNISRLEKGTYNPSLRSLKKVAKGLNKELHIEFR
jgi:predicted transcriptional regulator